MTDTAKLVEELRNPEWSDCNHHLIMETAADTIEALTQSEARRKADVAEAVAIAEQHGLTGRLIAGKIRAAQQEPEHG